MLNKREREQLQRDLKLQERVIMANSPEAIKAATRRLCWHCKFWKGEITTCGLLPLMQPLTLKGEDCPYYLPITFGPVVT